MARIRTIKPEFFVHEELYDLEVETGLPVRLAFAGLWTQADREGRFKWRPRTLKASILPFDDVDFSRVLDALATRGFLVRYACGTREYGQISSWLKHQAVNGKERPSEIPPPPQDTDGDTHTHDATQVVATTSNALATREPRVSHAYPKMEGKARAERKGKEGERKGVSDPSDLISADVSHAAPDDPPNGVLDFAFPMQADCWWMPARKLAEYTADYPWPVEPELRKAAAWLRENRKRRPRSPTGVKQFLTRWLNRHDDDLRNRGSPDKEADIDAWLDSLDLGEEDDTP